MKQAFTMRAQRRYLLLKPLEHLAGCPLQGRYEQSRLHFKGVSLMTLPRGVGLDRRPAWRSAPGHVARHRGGIIRGCPDF